MAQMKQRRPGGGAQLRDTWIQGTGHGAVPPAPGRCHHLDAYLILQQVLVGYFNLSKYLLVILDGGIFIKEN